MSSSVGYYYSAVDVEVARARELRGELAGQRARFDRVRARAAGLSVAVPRVKENSSGDSTALAAEVERLRAAITQAEQQVESAWDDRWRDRLRRVVAPAVAADDRSATDELADQRTERTRERNERNTRARQSAVDDAWNLVRAEGKRCASEDLDGLVRQVTALSELSSVDDVRSGALRVASAVAESVERRKVARIAEEKREALLALVAEAPEDERERLADEIRKAADPGNLSAAVHRAVERADVARHRADVATAAAKALTAAGCVVGADFATALTDREEAVVGFSGKPPGYGLLVRLPGDGASFVAAVVRSDGVTGGAEVDKGVQETFCTRLPMILETMRVAGVAVESTAFMRLEPGQRPVPAVPAARLPSTRKRPSTTTGTHSTAGRRLREMPRDS
ncbi:hypothetical protein [Umezawaea sp. Da 62-37]|uniref:hypothetical protein n=1 Tax=Umezawaea sp. Da 62-37 TaxID=3075927 RepID=UPI0028F6C2AA|nr:hypothetical protein [Umezawaea sp. Da 62-37]WNV85318.1 hypothetical protein RM788_45585 [Umezawaea sp. Da 62-37]